MDNDNSGNVYLKFNVGNVDIARLDSIIVPAGSQNYYYAMFNFADSWSSLYATARFSHTIFGDTRYYDVPIVAERVGEYTSAIPNSMMQIEGYFEIGVIASDKRVTNPVAVVVGESIIKPENGDNDDSGGIIVTPPSTPRDKLAETTAEAQALVQSDWTAISWAQLQSSLQNGIFVYNTPSMTNIQVSNAELSLRNAINNLVAV